MLLHSSQHQQMHPLPLPLPARLAAFSLVSRRPQASGSGLLPTHQQQQQQQRQQLLQHKTVQGSHLKPTLAH
jgi:hypothetical protein